MSCCADIGFNLCCLGACWGLLFWGTLNWILHFCRWGLILLRRTRKWQSFYGILCGGAVVVLGMPAGGGCGWGGRRLGAPGVGVAMFAGGSAGCWCWLWLRALGGVRGCIGGVVGLVSHVIGGKWGPGFAFFSGGGGGRDSGATAQLLNGPNWDYFPSHFLTGIGDPIAIPQAKQEFSPKGRG